jgi:plastocyanin
MRGLLAALLLSGLPPSGGAAVTGTIRVPEGSVVRKVVVRYTGVGAHLLKPSDPSLPVVWLEGAPASKAQGKTAEIVQSGLHFRPRVLAVQAGTAVKFPNGDDTFHNVFSLTPGASFDLGKYPQGQSKEETLLKPGRVDVRCKVHEHMRAYVHVFEHPHFAVAKEDGTFSIADVPAGKYTLVAWREPDALVRREIEVTGDGAKADLEFARLEEAPAAPLPGAGCCSAR